MRACDRDSKPLHSLYPLGGVAPRPWLTPRDARRVYYVMRTRRRTGVWSGVRSIVESVKELERSRGWRRLGKPRIARAIHWLVAKGLVERTDRVPFSKVRGARTVYRVVDASVPFPEEIPTHRARRRKRRVR